MKDEQKLTAAILGAIIAYLQVEQSPSATPLPDSPEAVSRQRSPKTDSAQ